jgi:hypothetical protein
VTPVADYLAMDNAVPHLQERLREYLAETGE